MIYCIGHTETYDNDMKKYTPLMKASGGTVWQTYKKALDYVKTRAEGFSVYGVDADWEKDTIQSEKWRELIRDARIIKL